MPLDKDQKKFRSIKALNRALMQAPPYIKGAGRIVPGQGPVRAAIALVGEQPGDQEDLQGLPFVGPAGKVLDQALAEAGIDRSACYLTNAVKQFKYTERGKKRLHQKPTTDEIVHYRWWLGLELDLIAPHVIVALGATAAFALSNQRISISAHRGPYALLGRPGYITTHPSAILRIPDRAARLAARKAFALDLKRISRLSKAGQVRLSA
jgi:uracil-DNA glycosylase